MSAVSYSNPNTYYAAKPVPARQAFGERGDDFNVTASATMSPLVPASLAVTGTGIVALVGGFLRKMPSAAFAMSAIVGAGSLAYAAANQRRNEQINEQRAMALDYLA
jgi:hypothetical protein